MISSKEKISGEDVINARLTEILTGIVDDLRQSADALEKIARIIASAKREHLQ